MIPEIDIKDVKSYMECEAQERIEKAINDLVKDRLNDATLNNMLEGEFVKFLNETK